MKKTLLFLTLLTVLVLLPKITNATENPVINSIVPQTLNSVDDMAIIYGVNFNYGDNRHLDCDGLRNGLGLIVTNWTDTSVQFKFDKNDWHYYLYAKDNYKCKIQVAIEGAPDYYSNEVSIYITPQCTTDDWTCDDWGNCDIDGTKARNCTKMTNCEGGVAIPETTQTCTYIAPVQETQEASGSFTLKIPDNRDNGVKSGDKIYIDYYGSSMIASVYLNNTKLNIFTTALDIISYYPFIINYQVVYFIIPDDAESGNIMVYDAFGKSKDIGNINIYTPPIDCSKFGKSIYNETTTECECRWGYEWNNYKTECISKDLIKNTNSELLLDTDNDGVADDYDYYPNKISEIITQNYTFNYILLDDNHGKKIDIKIEVPKDLYLYYQNQNHIFSESFDNITSFITYDDLIIKNIANQIDQLYKTQNFNPIAVAYQLVSQIVYTSDKFSIRGWDEYPKYPIETIVEKNGDCEDTTFLMASLIKALNFIDPLLVRFDNHLGLTLFAFDNPAGYKDIFYIETTGNGIHRPGVMPEALVGKNYTLHALDEYKRVSYKSNTQTNITEDNNLLKRVKGKILLQVESHGEAWYIPPEKNERYYMKDGPTAYEMLRHFGLGITNADLKKIPIEGSNQIGDYNLVNRLKGYILLQVEEHGEAWYVNPDDGKRYYMKDGDAAYQIMRFLSLGITNSDLSKIPVGTL